MPPQPIESKVDSLDRRVTQLEQLPARIDGLTLQVSQLRTEVRIEFSAVRGEMAEQGASLRQVIAEQGALRQEIAVQGTKISDLAAHMRVLHEDVISRIAQLQEGWSGQTRRRPKNR